LVVVIVDLKISIVSHLVLQWYSTIWCTHKLAVITTILTLHL